MVDFGITNLAGAYYRGVRLVGTIYRPHFQNTRNTNNTPILTSPVNSEVTIVFSAPKLV